MSSRPAARSPGAQIIVKGLRQGGILLESKDGSSGFGNLRQRLGRSPGKGDAVVMPWSEGNAAAVSRHNAHGRQMVCWKEMRDPIVARATGGAVLHATARYRDGARRPELMLMGAAYQSWFQAQADGEPRFSFRVERTDLPFFQGTGLRIGDELADVVGYEWDNRDPAGDGRRLWDEQRSAVPLLPAESIQVLFSGRPVDQKGRPGLAEAVYFVSPAGAKVFNAGSIRWAWGLGRADFEREPFKRFNENLVLYFMA